MLVLGTFGIGAYNTITYLGLQTTTALLAEMSYIRRFRTSCWSSACNASWCYPASRGNVFEQNFECLAPFGRYIIFGSTRGPGPPFEPRRLMQKSQTMSGIYLPVFLAKPDLIREGLGFLVDHASGGAVRAHVSSVLPLRQAAEAHRLLENRQVVGAVVLDPKC